MRRPFYMADRMIEVSSEVERKAELCYNDCKRVIFVEKRALRQRMKAARAALTEQQIERTGTALAQKLAAHPAYQKADALFCYYSCRGEISTLQLIKQALSDGKRIAVPKVTGDTMIFVWLDDLGAIQKGYCGIPEPVSSEEAVDETALMLLPGLAFDQEGRRCGAGGGYYDRYLALHPYHPTIGLCYDFQLVEKLETQPHDIPVEEVLSQEVLG